MSGTRGVNDVGIKITEALSGEEQVRAGIAKIVIPFQKCLVKPGVNVHWFDP